MASLGRRILGVVEEYTGYSLVESDHLRIQEAVAREAFVLANDMEELGYTALNYAQGRPSEPTANTRRRWAQQARVVWLADPMAGASVEMLNEFTFGRGVPRPHSKHKQVQEKLDEFWDNPQNQRVLTTFVAQMRFGTSLSIQSNVWWLMFDDGDDGEVVLSFLNHDTVMTAYTDPENRQRVLFWVAQKIEDEWDFRTHTTKVQVKLPKLFYYEAWGNGVEALGESGRDEKDATDLLDRYRKAADAQAKKDPVAEGDPINPGEPFDTGVGLMLPAPAQLGEGKVYHVGENFDMEMVFGVPRMRRTIRWYTAYNDFMAARVNMMQAAAAFIGKKKITAGGPNALERLAARGTRASSDLRSVMERAIDPEGVNPGPRSASVMQEAGGAEFEPLNLNSGAGNAETDAQMLRAQVSAGDRFPQHYLGDVGSANLATASTMELPVLKHVEARQELVEGVFRWGIDRKIERAVELGQIDPTVPDPDEEKDDDMPQLVRSIDTNTEVTEAEVLAESVDMVWRVNKRDVIRPTRIVLYTSGAIGYDLIGEALEQEQDDAEAATGQEVDMDEYTTYEFAMPSPLRRMMGDVVNAASLTAQFADPNGENTKLTKILLTWVLTEGFEIQDAGALVDEAFPTGYVPLSVQAMQQQLQAGPPDQPQQAGDGSDGQGGNFFSPDATALPANPDNAYSAKKQATKPSGAMQEAADDLLTVIVGRNGMPLAMPGSRRRSAFLENGKNGRTTTLDKSFEQEVRGDTMEALADLDMGRPNANGNGGAK